MGIYSRQFIIKRMLLKNKNKDLQVMLIVYSSLIKRYLDKKKDKELTIFK